jgi:hypothetical protein
MIPYLPSFVRRIGWNGIQRRGVDVTQTGFQSVANPLTAIIPRTIS